MLFGCSQRCTKDRYQFVCFLQEILSSVLPDYACFPEKFKPEDRLIGFFNDNSHARNKFCFGARTTNRAIVCRNRSA